MTSARAALSSGVERNRGYRELVEGPGKKRADMAGQTYI